MHRRVSGRIRARAADLSLPCVRRSARSGARSWRASRAFGRRLEEAVRRSLQAHGMAVWVRRVGQERVGVPRRPRRKHRVDGRRRHQPDVGRAVRQRARHGRALDQNVRPVAHRLVQGSRDDRARVGGSADDCRRQARSSGCLRIDRRHVGIARRVRGRRRNSVDRHSAARQGLDRAAGAAAGQRRPRALARHGFRRLHGHRAAAVG